MASQKRINSLQQQFANLMEIMIVKTPDHSDYVEIMMNNFTNHLHEFYSKKFGKV